MKLPNLKIKTTYWHGIPVNLPESKAGWLLYIGGPSVFSVVIIVLVLVGILQDS